MLCSVTSVTPTAIPSQTLSLMLLVSIDKENVCFGFCFCFNPSNAQASFAQCTGMQRFLKTIQTLSCWYSLESSH